MPIPIAGRSREEVDLALTDEALAACDYATLCEAAASYKREFDVFPNAIQRHVEIKAQQSATFRDYMGRATKRRKKMAAPAADDATADNAPAVNHDLAVRTLAQLMEALGDEYTGKLEETETDTHIRIYRSTPTGEDEATHVRFESPKPPCVFNRARWVWYETPADEAAIVETVRLVLDPVVRSPGALAAKLAEIRERAKGGSNGQ